MGYFIQISFISKMVDPTTIHFNSITRLLKEYNIYQNEVDALKCKSNSEMEEFMQRRNRIAIEETESAMSNILFKLSESLSKLEKAVISSEKNLDEAEKNKMKDQITNTKNFLTQKQMQV